MSVNWEHVGGDFKQKYEGTFCRFRSPISKKKEIFQIIECMVYPDQPPDLTLHNVNHGELFLRYTTEGELDFAFPDCGYFQYQDKACRFVRNYERQWKKGVCETTARIIFPYDSLYEVEFPQITDQTLLAAYENPRHTLGSGLRKLKEDGCVSVALNKTTAIGLGNREKDVWLWFESEPVGFVADDGSLQIYVPEFVQEFKDFLRNTGDHDRAVIQIS